MSRIARITSTYVRHYRDTGQHTAYVEWVDHKGQRGRTEGAWPPGTHLYELLKRARREGVPLEAQVWGA